MSLTCDSVVCFTLRTHVWLTALQTNITYTCGEDGYVRAWLMEGNEKMDIDDATEVKRKKKEKKEKRKEKKEKRKGEDEGKKGRYAPY